MVYVIEHYDDFDDGKFIGVVDNVQVAIETVNKYSKLPGFCDYPDGFSITEMEVIGSTDTKPLSEIYCLESYLLDEEGDEQDVVMLGIFAKRKDAEEFRRAAKRKEKNRKRRYYIGKGKINQLSWVDGYIRIPY